MDLRLLDHGLLNGGVGNNLGSLDGLVINVSFNSLLGNIFNFSFISVLGNMFGDVFDLLIVSVLFLHGLISGLFNSLIFGHGFDDGDIFGSLLGNIFGNLSFIRNLNLGNNGFIISVGFFNWDVLNIRLSLRLRLLVNDLGLNNGLDQRLLNVRGLNIRLNILRLVLLLYDVSGSLAKNLRLLGLHFYFFINI